MKSVVGGVLLRPWFDAAAVRMLTRWYFPLSRAWAAGLAAEGSPERFLAALPCGDRTRRLAPGVLARLEQRRTLLKAATSRWEAALFGRGEATYAVELARQDAAFALMAARALFAPLHVERPFPPVAWRVEEPDRVAARHWDRLLHPETAFAEVGPIPEVGVSRSLQTPHGAEQWLRFRSPAAAGDVAWAKIEQPRGLRSGARGRGPTLIFAHGVAVESEFWGDRVDPVAALVDAGIRVIRPEAPWHGRRRLPGHYGGEPVFARGPGGLLDFFHAHVVEIGIITAWARATWGGPVAVGGISLGALTAQLAAVAARHWPEAMRPDALFLISPSLSMASVAFEGSLSKALGVPEALRQAGWASANTGLWRPLLEPTEPPPLPADRIVVILGEADDVTLFVEGQRLCGAWGLPKANVFRHRAGHFSTSLALVRDSAPLRRFASLLAMIGERSP